MFCALCVAEHLVDVKSELGQFVKWKTLGLNLGLSSASLEVIEEDYRFTNERLEAVLLRWLRKCYNLHKYGSPTWSQLAEAVEPIDCALAITIKERHP